MGVRGRLGAERLILTEDVRSWKRLGKSVTLLVPVCSSGGRQWHVEDCTRVSTCV